MHEKDSNLETSNLFALTKLAFSWREYTIIIWDRIAIRLKRWIRSVLFDVFEELSLSLGG